MGILYLRLTPQKFSSSITSCLYTLLVKARYRPSGEGTKEPTQAAPKGISCKTLGLPFASIARTANEEPDPASANQIFPSAAQLTSHRDDHFQLRMGVALLFDPSDSESESLPFLCHGPRSPACRHRATDPKDPGVTCIRQGGLFPRLGPSRDQDGKKLDFRP